MVTIYIYINNVAQLWKVSGMWFYFVVHWTPNEMLRTWDQRRIGTTYLMHHECTEFYIICRSLLVS